MSLVTEFPVRTAQTSTPINEVLAQRWSPRSYDPNVAIDERALTAALEAARWSLSAANSQPWRFIVARRGSAAFNSIVANLKGFNATWATSAGVLIVGLTELTDAEGTLRPWGRYDLGQALAHLSIQAHHDGLHAHQMGGFDSAGLRQAFAIPAQLEPVSVTALGVLGEAEALPEPLRSREVAPRTRLPLDELLFVNQ